MSRTQLPARLAYRELATSYEVENAVTTLEDETVRALTPALAGARLLDAACGTARRLRGVTDASLRVGVDLVSEMLAVQRQSAAVSLVAGDLRLLPVRTDSFDVVWCRLAIGHVAELSVVYAELARVVTAGGTVVVSDFHPSALAAGHTRSFRSEDGREIEVKSFVHHEADHLKAAADAGLFCSRMVERRIGPEVERFYHDSGRLDWYSRDFGLPLVIAFQFLH